jgi:hypothetical protein
MAANIVWTSTLDEARLISKELRAIDIKIKRLLQSRSTRQQTLWECHQAKTYVEAARKAIAQIPKVKNNEKQMTQLLILAASNLHTAIIHTAPVEGLINKMLCTQYVRVFNILPIGCAFQGRIF